MLQKPHILIKTMQVIMTERLLVKGIVVAGAGEGKYYTRLGGYQKEFIKKLGFKPYPGTLNLELPSAELEKLNILRSARGIIIEEFENEDGTSFGAVKCFHAEIKNIKCAVILPERSRYKNVIEVISKEYLRKKLELKNGDLLDVTIFLE